MKKKRKEPLIPYEQWKALGPEKASEYLSRRRWYSAKTQGALWAILEVAWARDCEQIYAAKKSQR